MDPDFLPPSKVGRQPNVSVEGIRVLSGSQQAGCVMAQYHYQHQLPHSLLLQKGLLGFLLDTEQGKRFASSPEILTMHGARTQFFIPASDRAAMRILGNSLSCQHATFALSLAMQALDIVCPHPADCVAECLHQRMTASNCLLLEIEGGWLMCHQQDAAAVFSRQSLKQQVMQKLRTPTPRFHVLELATGSGKATRRTTCHVSEHLEQACVLQRLGVENPRLYHDVDTAKTYAEASEPLFIPLLQSVSRHSCTDPCLHALADGQHYFLHRFRPDIFEQLVHVFKSVPGHLDRNVICLDLAGHRCPSVPDMPKTVFAVVDVDNVLQEAPLGPATMLERCLPLPHTSAFTLSIPADQAVDWWLSLPFHLTAALGFSVECSVFPPPAGSSLLINVHPDGGFFAPPGSQVAQGSAFLGSSQMDSYAGAMLAPG